MSSCNRILEFLCWRVVVFISSSIQTAHGKITWTNTQTNCTSLIKEGGWQSRNIPLTVVFFFFCRQAKLFIFLFFPPAWHPVFDLWCLIEALLSKPEEQQQLQVPGLWPSAHPTCACWMDQKEPAEPRKAECQQLVLAIFLLCFFQLQEKMAGSWKSQDGRKRSWHKTNPELWSWSWLAAAAAVRWQLHALASVRTRAGKMIWSYETTTSLQPSVSVSELTLGCGQFQWGLTGEARQTKMLQSCKVCDK